MDSSTTNLDGDDRVQHPHGRFEWFQVRILVGENSELSRAYAHTYAGVHVFVRRLEPGITLGLDTDLMLAYEGMTWIGEDTYPLEDVVQESVVGVVVHEGHRGQRRKEEEGGLRCGR